MRPKGRSAGGPTAGQPDHAAAFVYHRPHGRTGLPRRPVTSTLNDNVPQSSTAALGAAAVIHIKISCASSFSDQFAYSSQAILLRIVTTVRSAHRYYAPRIRELLTQMGYPADLAHVAQRLVSLQDDSSSAVFVVEKDGLLLGVISLHAFDLFHQAGRIGRITALVVDAAAQRVGVGSALLAAADEFFRGVGCIRAEVTSGDHRAGAHAFYASRGY